MEDTRPRGGPLSGPGFHLWRATQRWSAWVSRSLEPLGLTHSQYFVLAAVGFLSKGKGQKPPRQRDVGAFTGIEPMMVSKIARALESRGLVERADDPNDSRAWRLELTTKGESLSVRAASVLKALDAEFFAPVGSEVGELNQQLLELASD